MQRPPSATQRHFLGVPQNYTSTPQNSVQVQFQQTGMFSFYKAISVQNFADCF